MARSVNINPDKLLRAAATVAEHLTNAAIPPADALPPELAPSPVDLAAARFAAIVHNRIGTATDELGDKAPLLDGPSTDGSQTLRVSDVDNASRLTAVEGVDSQQRAQRS